MHARGNYAILSVAFGPDTNNREHHRSAVQSESLHRRRSENNAAMRPAVRSVWTEIHHCAAAAQRGRPEAGRVSAARNYRQACAAVHAHRHGAEGDLCAAHGDGAAHHVPQAHDARSEDCVCGAHRARSEGRVHQPLCDRAARDLPDDAVPAEAAGGAGAGAARIQLLQIGAGGVPLQARLSAVPVAGWFAWRAGRVFDRVRRAVWAVARRGGVWAGGWVWTVWRTVRTVWTVRTVRAVYCD